MQNLADLFEPVVESMGYELVGVEFERGGGHGTLRVYIDSARFKLGALNTTHAVALAISSGTIFP